MAFKIIREGDPLGLPTGTTDAFTLEGGQGKVIISNVSESFSTDIDFDRIYTPATGLHIPVNVDSSPLTLSPIGSAFVIINDANVSTNIPVLHHTTVENSTTPAIAITGHGKAKVTANGDTITLGLDEIRYPFEYVSATIELLEDSFLITAGTTSSSGHNIITKSSPLSLDGTPSSAQFHSGKGIVEIREATAAGVETVSRLQLRNIYDWGIERLSGGVTTITPIGSSVLFRHS